VSRAAVVAACAALVALFGTAVGWQTERPRAATAASAPTEGADLFAAKGCATCHTGPDTHALFESFPSLASASDWAVERRPGVSAAEYVAESIRNPSAFISPAFVSGGGPTTGMPYLGLSDAEVDALVEYLLGG
jgi:mono/diheme cytochrome c family protein